MAGDAERQRFQTVVMPHLGNGFALACWLAGNRLDAEDILQDACINAFRGINGFSGQNARAWFLAIVRNAAYSWLKKNRSMALLSFDETGSGECSQAELDATSFAGPHSTPEVALMAKHTAMQLQAAIEKLSPQWRETLVLRDIHGLNYREIAQVTCVPIGTVMSRLARARRHVIVTIQADEK